jgi:hypothetical protein
LEDGGVLEQVDDEGSFEARSNLPGAIAAASSGLLNTVDSANKIAEIAAASSGLFATVSSANKITKALGAIAAASPGLLNTVDSANRIAEIAAGLSGLFYTVGSTNPMRGGWPPSASFSLLPGSPIESSSSIIISDQEIGNRCRHLAKSIILIDGPVCSVLVLYIAWSVAVHKSPETGEHLLAILAIIGFIVPIIPTIKKVAEKLGD